MKTPASICTAAELTAFKRRLAKVDPILANLIRVAGKFTHTTSAQHSPFHSLARAIAHQQLNGTAAESIFGRLAHTVGLLDEGRLVATGTPAELKARDRRPDARRFVFLALTGHPAGPGTETGDQPDDERETAR